MESDVCWWRCGGRQSREHLFKECRTWKSEIRKLWTEVGEISGAGTNGGENRGVYEIYKGRKGFCFGVAKRKRRPVRDLLSDERFTEAVLKFLEETGVGKVKQGVELRTADC